MTYRQKKFSGFGNEKRKPVTKTPTEGKKEVKIKTNSSKLYGVDNLGYEPPVKEEDKN